MTDAEKPSPGAITATDIQRYLDRATQQINECWERPYMAEYFVSSSDWEEFARRGYITEAGEITEAGQRELPRILSARYGG